MTIDLVETLGGEPREECAMHGHDWRTVTAPVDVAGWPAAWRECSRCRRRAFLWLPAPECKRWPGQQLAPDLATHLAEQAGQLRMFP